jgi:dipeptidyl-peptidase-2/lysosomal Pro-X carboxypeptidase
VFLTLDNVMADAVEFVEQLRANVSGASTSKAMVASGRRTPFLSVIVQI